MRAITLATAIACALFGGCDDRKGAEHPAGPDEFQLTIPATFALADPIPEGDEWLKTFRQGNGYESGWETWVWRLTDIEVAAGIKVYARDPDERQFLVTGCDEFELLSIDFRISEVGHTGFYSGVHNVKLTPSGKYIVCLVQNPRAYIHGLPIDDRVKLNGEWVVHFEQNTANWRKAESSRASTSRRRPECSPRPDFFAVPRGGVGVVLAIDRHRDGVARMRERRKNRLLP